MGWRLCQTALAPGRRLLLVWRRGPPTPLSFNHQTRPTSLDIHSWDQRASSCCCISQHHSACIATRIFGCAVTLLPIVRSTFSVEFWSPLVESLPPVSCHVPKTIASALLLALPPSCRIDHHLLVLSSSKPTFSTSCPLTSSSFATDGICVAAGLLIQSLSPPAVFRATFILLFKLSWSECFL